MSPPASNLEDVLQRIVQHEREIRAFGVSRLALFGSVLRGTPNERSDVDILVQFLPGMKSYDRYLALSELLESCLERRVELVTTESLSPFIGPRILEQAEDVLRAA
jgi:predicted nucleotidyltransferase